ncbi:hypothetical protein MPF_0057 [Methanohalophilus portucalensis FDF-1]|uniref:Uncharacterized protein n=3 Tax=Methanohalophilus portucalensis TaxID=39664 RepID=A0A1L9C6R7_9EURY|nr:hypothetical protein MPF_0057 [Methanohalophilus portucalensis FDF-1]
MTSWSIYMNFKLSITLIALITLFLLTAGCLVTSQQNDLEKYELKYNFKQGEQYSYEVLTAIEKPSTKVSETTDIYVVSEENNHINLKVLTKTVTNTKSEEQIYHMNMTPSGEIIKIKSNDLIIPEIQLELVSILEYPKKEFAEGDVWSSYFSKNDSLFIDNNLVEYTVSGNTTYKCSERSEISVKAGKFDCVAIETTTDYILDAKYKSENESIFLKTNGVVQGENWIDLDRGFLAKSEYNVNKNTMTDFSELYKDLGIENIHRSTPQKSYTASELIDIKRK